jgi:hypothetical protein
MVGNGMYGKKILGLQYEKGNVFIKGRICLEYLIVSSCAHGGPFGCFWLAFGRQKSKIMAV